MPFDISFFFSLICSLGGVTFFTISLFVISKIKKLFPGTKLIKKWVIIQILILLFLFGYVFNITFLVLYASGEDVVAVLNVMTAIVYIFGGLFVLIVVNLSFKTYKTIIMGKSK